MLCKGFASLFFPPLFILHSDSSTIVETIHTSTSLNMRFFTVCNFLIVWEYFFNYKTVFSVLPILKYIIAFLSFQTYATTPYYFKHLFLRVM